MGREKHSVARSAGVMAFFTLLSRIAGLVRDMVIAFSFGAASHADAFFVAFRIPNLLRRLVAEGALTASFLPVYVDHLENRGPREAERVANITFTLLAIVLALLTVAGIVFSPWIVRVFAPGFISMPETFHLTVRLNQICFPYIFFVSLVALCMGILNARGHFAAPAASPILLNIFMILGALVVARLLDPPVLGLAVGVVLGGLFQLLLQIPALVHMQVRVRPCFSFRDPAVRRIVRLFLPAAFGAAVYQLNLFVSNLLASFLPSGSISYLYYASRLLEFPLGVFGIALAQAAFPHLSRQSSRKDANRFQGIMDETLGLVTFICLPAAVGLVVLRVPITEILFQRGAFDPEMVRCTAEALLCYTLGMWPIAAARILISAFYALQDTATPVKLSLVSFVANVVLSLVLMGPLRHSGLALANSLSSLLNVVLLFCWYRKRVGDWGLNWVRGTGSKVALGCVGMGLSVWLATSLVVWGAGGSTLHRAALLAFYLAVGLCSYLAVCRLLGVREIRALAGILARGRRAGTE
jgi:putative peptidoglycan lipid II flippase